MAARKGYSRWWRKKLRFQRIRERQAKVRRLYKPGG